MKVDYHVHLEEGPYSFRWLEQTNQALHYYHSKNVHFPQSQEWMKQSLDDLQARIANGAYHSDWLNLYLQEALRLGLKEVGIVDHLYRFSESRYYYEKNINVSEHSQIGRIQKKWLQQVMNQNIRAFVDFINTEKQHWKNHGVKLKLGLETDYFPGCENELQPLIDGYDWDFIIGSVHFIHGWGFDNPATEHLFLEYNLEILYDEFFDIVEKAIRSRMFDFIAHLDNLKVFGHRPQELKLIPYYRRIAKALVETHTPTEVNAGLFYRYPIKEMCPSPTFLEVLCAEGVLFTLSSDAHFPQHLGNYIYENTLYLQRQGLTDIVTFSKRKQIIKRGV
ncbi:histidinol phosphate phosphatase domain-containing protein [Bacillus alkalicellulosilyticus]|uniref:histidinol phosphate phosphatase domain-containing protein n=1 Tax=Alkalihalobacterium alkalicellulosilyticum TaxID=1912214 RepID=UPI0009969FDC|nr:histidinol phosphate phosphatase domain-containing protein [Bacillus alkalicellulosilyticus]